MPKLDSKGKQVDVDLSNCDREPIHILGHVQSFGCLLAVSSDWIVVHASTNCAEMLGLNPEGMIGKPFTDFFSPRSIHDLRTRVQALAYQTGCARMFGYDVFEDGRYYNVSMHRSDQFLVFEFEKTTLSSADQDDTGLVQALIGRVQRHDSVEMASEEAARAIQALTGMDRVMVYRFDEDGTGTVIAEVLKGRGEPYLGLRYPASDVPKQARELYKKNLLRIISDVNSETYPILPKIGPSGDPLDLSLSVSRAVSPIHLEYLRNMGVQASMSVSIMRRDKLWGLFACHHHMPRNLDYKTRSTIELFAQLFNYELAQIEMAQEFNDLDTAQILHDKLMSQISGGVTLLDIFDSFSDEIRSVIPFDGVVVYSGGKFKASGMTPTEEEFMGLARFLNTTKGSQVYATDNLASRYEAADSFEDRAVGLLALPISRKPRDYLVFFRRELAQTVTWAGNPEKPVELGPHGARLTPRKSFAAWKEVVHGKCASWRESELRAAETLRVTLIEVVLKLSDEAEADRKKAEQAQELLIAELNHRVRNILTLIQGLISQGHGKQVSIEEYSRVLDERIHALARAHDQLTQKEWSWVPLKSLIQTEIKAFQSEKSERVLIEGEDIALSPTAFTTLALVMHELVTNSAKYGALSVPDGSVQLKISRMQDGSCHIAWRDCDGPPVSAPKRKGFGTTIIERSIPFELRGEADVRYKVTGFEADFVLPAPHVQEYDAMTFTETAEQDDIDPTDITLSGEVLVLEDNMIIAMDASDMLSELGAKTVHTANSTNDALQILEHRDITFALLDVNLGKELSLKVAKECATRNIPTILATGYEGNDTMTEAFPQTLVIRKPYTVEHIRKAVAKCFKG
ncbi:MAG: HWE histidine kinase domain-containing protein [Pseudomonadota bacterium]|nr:HWE histidine kinase domain-containing protein [Pseudomonadota bacterium]